MDDDTKSGIVVMAILGSMLTAFAFYCVGYSRGQSDTKGEAIKTGVAHWTADNEGKPKFEWIVPPEKRP